MSVYDRCQPRLPARPPVGQFGRASVIYPGSAVQGVNKASAPEHEVNPRPYDRNGIVARNGITPGESTRPIVCRTV